MSVHACKHCQRLVDSLEVAPEFRKEHVRHSIYGLWPHLFTSAFIVHPSLSLYKNVLGFEIHHCGAKHGFALLCASMQFLYLRFLRNSQVVTTSKSIAVHLRRELTWRGLGTKQYCRVTLHRSLNRCSFVFIVRIFYQQTGRRVLHESTNCGVVRFYLIESS